MKTLLITAFLLAFAPLAEAKSLSEATYNCTAADGSKATYRFSITDDKAKDVWGLPSNREIHEVNGRERQINSEIATYWVLPPSDGSVIGGLPRLGRPTDNDNRYVKSLILLNAQTVKAYACILEGGDF